MSDARRRRHCPLTARQPLLSDGLKDQRKSVTPEEHDYVCFA